MRHLITLILIITVFLAGSTAASAQAQNPQPPPADAARFTTEIVVTPERGETPRSLVPASTVVIDAASLQTLPVVHPSEVVSFLPGFSAARPQFYAGRPVVSARGFFGGGEAEYLLLLVDGVPIADVESGLIDWSVIPASSMRRIEAIRGPGAALYGDSAVGGVIQILTNRPAGGELTATGGSFRTFTADGTYGRRLPRVGFNLSGAARRTDGGFQHSGGQQIVGGGSVDGAFRGFSWRWNATGDERDRDDPGVLSRDQFRADPYASDPLYRFDTLDRHSFSTAFTLRHNTPIWTPRVRLYTTVRDEDLVRTIALAPGLGDRRARRLSTVVVGGSLEGEHAFSGTHSPMIRFGLDVSREQLDTTYRSVSASGDIGAVNSQAAGHRFRAGVFASSSWDPVPRVRISGALRWDDADDEGFGSSSAPSATKRAWSPRAGVVFQLTDSGSIALFAQISRAFKLPTLDQLFDPRPFPDFRGGTFTISSRRLVPQRATNAEVGISGGGRVRWSALAYRMTVDDEIDFDIRTFSYGNIGRSRHVGTELEAEGRWWKRVRPSVTYMLSRVGDVGSDQQLKNVPRHRITAAAHVDWPFAISMYVGYNRTWGAFLDDAGGYAIDGPSTLDCRVRRPIGRHALFVDVLNVTGNVYEEYGFTLADFRGRVVPYVYPGAPRAVRAGLTISF
jgi:outer membrane receptor protein involved in Fe transport